MIKRRFKRRENNKKREKKEDATLDLHLSSLFFLCCRFEPKHARYIYGGLLIVHGGIICVKSIYKGFHERKGGTLDCNRQHELDSHSMWKNASLLLLFFFLITYTTLLFLSSSYNVSSYVFFCLSPYYHYCPQEATTI